jgi:hypothetical protein
MLTPYGSTPSFNTAPEGGSACWVDPADGKRCQARYRGWFEEDQKIIKRVGQWWCGEPLIREWRGSSRIRGGKKDQRDYRRKPETFTPRGLAMETAISMLCLRTLCQRAKTIPKVDFLRFHLEIDQQNLLKNWYKPRIF